MCAYLMPFLQTAPAAGRGGVLGNKHRMAAHRGLFTVVGRFCWCQPSGDKIGGMSRNLLFAFAKAVVALFGTQMKTLAETRA